MRPLSYTTYRDAPELRLRQRDQGVACWIGKQRFENCFLSVVSIVEIQRLDGCCLWMWEWQAAEVLTFKPWTEQSAS